MSVSDRFIAELEKLPPDADGKENRRTELLLRSMRFLRVKASIFIVIELRNSLCWIALSRVCTSRYI
jgi:hypothetical protein